MRLFSRRLLKAFIIKIDITDKRNVLENFKLILVAKPIKLSIVAY